MSVLEAIFRATCGVFLVLCFCVLMLGTIHTVCNVLAQLLKVLCNFPRSAVVVVVVVVAVVVPV